MATGEMLCAAAGFPTDRQDHRTVPSHEGWQGFIASIGSAISRRVDGDQPTKAPPTEKTTMPASTNSRKPIGHSDEANFR